MVLVRDKCAVISEWKAIICFKLSMSIEHVALHSSLTFWCGSSKVKIRRLSYHCPCVSA